MKGLPAQNLEKKEFLSNKTKPQVRVWEPSSDGLTIPHPITVVTWTLHMSPSLGYIGMGTERSVIRRWGHFSTERWPIEELVPTLLSLLTNNNCRRNPSPECLHVSKEFSSGNISIFSIFLICQFHRYLLNACSLQNHGGADLFEILQYLEYK